MFKLDSENLKLLSGESGRGINDFVNDLIRGEMLVNGISIDTFSYQLRTNIGDGGADSSLSVPIPKSISGYLTCRSCWQFKSSLAYVQKSLIAEIKKEMRKPYAADLIQKGYGYRFALLADVREPATKAIEAAMLDVATQLCAEKEQANAVTPRLVDGAKLLSWASTQPAVAVTLLNQYGEFVDLKTWVEAQQSQTPTYVPNPDWSAIANMMRTHVDFQQPPVGNNIVLPISGPSGVGKTRLVAETLVAINGASALVVQTSNDAEARRLASHAARSAGCRMILVVDECGAEAIYEIRNLLAKCTDRVRVIAIEHLERLRTSQAYDPGRWLEKMSPDIIRQILESNFPEIDKSDRRFVTAKSDGSIRFAALICDNSDTIDFRDLTQSATFVDDFLERYLADDDRRNLLGLLALFQRIGFRDEVVNELDCLLEVSGTDKRQMMQQVDHLKRISGFVLQEGRYWYVSPEVILPSLFRHGWRHFVEYDLHAFLEKLPPNMLAQLHTRASRYGGEEVTAQLADYFRDAMSNLSVTDLQNSRIAEIAVTVIELDPDRFLPSLTRLLESADDTAIAALDQYDSMGRHGGRRYLIWMLEKMACFSEYFAEAERSLFRLAQYETEPNIGNNATKTWASLFRIRGSGTSLHFRERLPVLADRLSSSNEGELCKLAVENVLQRPTGKPTPPEFYMGRRVPDAWRPDDEEEEAQLLVEGIQAIANAISRPTNQTANQLLEGILDSLFWPITRGVISPIREALDGELLSAAQSMRLRNRLINIETSFYSDDQTNTPPHHDQLLEWISALQPSDFGGRLRSLISCDLWDDRFRPEMQNEEGELSGLADEVVKTPALLLSELDWLHSEEALSANRIGFTIGKRDVEQDLAPPIADAAVSSGNVEFMAGYFRAICSLPDPPQFASELISAVDKITESYPKQSLQLLISAGDHVDAFDRLIRMTSARDVGSCDVINFAHHFGRSVLSVSRFRTLFRSLHTETDGSERDLLCLIKLLHVYHLSSSREGASESLYNESSFTDEVVSLLQDTVSIADGRIAGEWIKIAKALVQSGHTGTFSVLQESLLTEHLTLTRLSLQLLTELASVHAQSVMDAFGASVTDKERGIYLRVHVCSELVDALPPEIVLDWVRVDPESRSKLIARHLPTPGSVDEFERGGDPDNADEAAALDEAWAIPELLDQFLQEFGSNEVLSELHAGHHSRGGWSGQMSLALRNEAARFEHLLSHENQWVQRWAQEEVRSLRDWADREEIREREESILDQ
ncbi:hypothetical protein SAMN06265222_109107 [Neorhodopirellula lusitana]|uniref:AAA+ ATPase domain-containing protein n=1 Tax=Neorhodopirellula lusitana TaxID=445327 RepID=A0ABY1QD73_9BACT|nr:hypothetical protein [Neorhodopirellula lusitana]SMP65596.1 hypothetical protein SAMN06265222_109107 [Neorhodopirellula lusitana]